MAAVKKTCSDTLPTWEQRCRLAEAEAKRLEAERVAMAKQIHALNLRVTYAPSAQEKIAELKEKVSRLESSLRLHSDKWTERDEKHAETVRGLTEKLSEARAEATDLREQLQEALDGDSESSGLDMDAEVEALTDVIRAAKAIRRRWRE